jgi:hypothetical protein
MGSIPVIRPMAKAATDLDTLGPVPFVPDPPKKHVAISKTRILVFGGGGAVVVVVIVVLAFLLTGAHSSKTTTPGAGPVFPLPLSSYMEFDGCENTSLGGLTPPQWSWNVLLEFPFHPVATAVNVTFGDIDLSISGANSINALNATANTGLASNGNPPPAVGTWIPLGSHGGAWAFGNGAPANLLTPLNDSYWFEAHASGTLAGTVVTATGTSSHFNGNVSQGLSADC